MSKNCFKPADILLPKDVSYEKFAVVACDQYTSELEYWKRVEKFVGDDMSSLHMIYPEIYLDKKPKNKIKNIHDTMNKYLKDDMFKSFVQKYIYLERKMTDGKIRKGIVGAVDLEEYDYNKGSQTAIRATEETVLERIPPRVKIRNNAALELPHVMLLFDDPKKTVIEKIDVTNCEKAYDFGLMENGGHITGYFLDDKNSEHIEKSLSKLAAKTEMLFAVGDGNHSLAAAKSCYEQLKKKQGEKAKTSPARYALCEIVNLHDDSLVFEPIHRVLTEVDPQNVITELRNFYRLTKKEQEHPIHYITKDDEQTLHLKNPKASLPVGTIQDFIGHYIENHGGKVDYIHGDDVVISLSKAKNTIGFFVPTIHKSQLFDSVIKDGALVRKTFSMGHANEKRFYLEARIILQ